MSLRHRIIIVDRGQMVVKDYGRAPTLTELQGLVGGSLEGISADRSPLHGKGFLQVLANEDALRLNLPPNVRVPNVYALDGVVRGPVLLVGVDREGDDRDLTDGEIRRVRLVAPSDGSDYPTLVLGPYED